MVLTMDFAEFHFIRPYWLLALIPAVVIFTLLLKNKLNQASWSNVCDTALLPFVLQDRISHQSRWMLFTGTFTCLLAILSLAGPTWERMPSPVFRNEAALVIALDLSRSMDATDIKPSRLIRARYKIADILKQRKDGQTALIVYTNDAFTVTPLTDDNETIASQLTALSTGIMPSQGSNTVIALQKTVELLKQAGFQTGDILLVTDGVDFNQSSDMVESLAGYRLSILGVGTAEGAPIKLAQGGFIKDGKGNIVVPKLNNSELSQLAIKGNGIYQAISSDNSDIETLLSQLNKPMEKEDSQDKNLLIDQWNEKGPWLLLLVLPLAALQFRKGILSLALISLLPFPENSYALEWNDLWQTQNQRAQQAFEQKKYQQAAEQFDNSQWKAAAQYKAGQYQQAVETLQNDQSAPGQYNLGNALAESGKLKEAIEAYDKSLQIEPENEDAKYNKEQVEKELEKQQQKQQQSDQNDSEKKDGENKDQQDSSEKPGDNQNKSEQDEADQNKADQDNAEQNQSEKNEQQQSEKDSEQTNESENEQQAQQEKEAEQNEAEEAKKQQAAEPSEYNESEQANEQWLNRIPDDPAGLLRRKFKYQYGQRGRKQNNSNAW